MMSAYLACTMRRLSFSVRPVHSTQVRLDMTSPAPGTAAGFLQIVELHVLSNGVNIV